MTQKHPDDVAAVDRALQDGPDGDWNALALFIITALAESCAERLPKGVAEVVNELQHFDHSLREAGSETIRLRCLQAADLLLALSTQVEQLKRDNRFLFAQAQDKIAHAATLEAATARAEKAEKEVERFRRITSKLDLSLQEEDEDAHD